MGIGPKNLIFMISDQGAIHPYGLYPDIKTFVQMQFFARVLKRLRPNFHAWLLVFAAPSSQGIAEHASRAFSFSPFPYSAFSSLSPLRLLSSLVRCLPMSLEYQTDGLMSLHLFIHQSTSCPLVLCQFHQDQVISASALSFTPQFI